MKEIHIKEVKIEVKESGGIEIIYQPDTLQVLEAGKLYRIVFDAPPGMKIIQETK